MPRIFVYEGKQLPDPNPEWSVDRVREHFSVFMPGLANAETEQREEGDSEVHEFRRRVGTKGLEDRKIVAVIASVPEHRLSLIDLINELAPGGQLDYEEAVRRQPEINLAVIQAGHYISQTRGAAQSLWELPARSRPD